MNTHSYRLAALVTAAALGLSVDASADGRQPGSLLLYPVFDNTDSHATVLTVTNVSDDDVYVEFVYIDGDSCAEFNRTELLTGNDTLTLLTDVHNPRQVEGYVYVFAKDAAGEPVVHNALIGNLFHVEGLDAYEWSVNPVAFEGLDVDVNGNGIRDLDGVEYETSPDELQIPRFFGQESDEEGTPFDSDLVLIGLGGGAAFDTTVDFLIYNDNEEVFSAELSFYCWTEVDLTEISGIFANAFLRNNTNHDPQEILGASNLESGWFRVSGAVAWSTTTTIVNPAVYAFLSGESGPSGVADLPFEVGENDTGKLLARSNDGQF